MLKSSIRDKILTQRRQQSVESALAKSIKIQQRLAATSEFRHAGSVALYSPIHGEVFTEGLFDVCRQEGRTLAYPRVRGEQLDFVQVEQRHELAPGGFGVLEPTGSLPVLPSALDLIVVPGVAFDGSGFRLGYGKGFYDRALHAKSSTAVLVGVCFELQLVDVLPAESHDIRMNMVVTEERILRF